MIFSLLIVILGVLMYDSDSMCIYHVSLNEITLLDTFSTTWNKEPSLPFEILSPDKLSNQLAVLQHQLQTTTDPTKSKNVRDVCWHFESQPKIMNYIEYIEIQ